MSITIYCTSNGYYYALQMGAPKDTVLFGEGSTPASAGSNLEPTQYQSADFGCRVPAPSKLSEWFIIGGDDDELEYGSDDDDREASDAFDESNESDVILD